jgi:pimeloyl-ACP methyl ester carboxylesterase
VRKRNERNMATTGEQIRLQDGRSLGYAEYGDPGGKPVFFFQGTPSSRLLHPDESITAALGARLIMLDRPGFGLSSFQPGRRLLDWPNDVVDVAGQLGFERFAVVGISGGGPYVAACARRIPERLVAAAMVSSMAPVDVPGSTKGMPPIRRAGAYIGRHTPRLVRPLVWLTSNPRRDPDRFFKRNTAHNPLADQELLARPEFRDMLMASYAEATRAGIQGYAWEVRIIARPWGFRLKDIPIEVHLWHGEEDTSTPLAMARYMAGAIPRCRARFLPGEGHFLLFTHWGEILTTLLEG